MNHNISHCGCWKLAPFLALWDFQAVVSLLDGSSSNSRSFLTNKCWSAVYSVLQKCPPRIFVVLSLCSACLFCHCSVNSSHLGFPELLAPGLQLRVCLGSPSLHHHLETLQTLSLDDCRANLICFLSLRITAFHHFRSNVLKAIVSCIWSDSQFQSPLFHLGWKLKQIYTFSINNVDRLIQNASRSFRF